MQPVTFLCVYFFFFFLKQLTTFSSFQETQHTPHGKKTTIYLVSVHIIWQSLLQKQITDRETAIVTFTMYKWLRFAHALCTIRHEKGNQA